MLHLGVPLHPLTPVFPSSFIVYCGVHSVPTVWSALSHLCFSFYPSAPSPTAPKITFLTTHCIAPPAATKPKAVICPQPNSILNASIFWTATAHATPRRTQSTPPPCVERKLNTEVTLELLGGDSDTGYVASEVSPYFQTTIKMGNRDMQELTNRAVEMELGVGFFGGAGSGAMLVPLGLALPSSSFLCCSSSAVAPSFQKIASQRMAKC